MVGQCLGGSVMMKGQCLGGSVLVESQYLYGTVLVEVQCPGGRVLARADSVKMSRWQYVVWVEVQGEGLIGW